MRLRLIVPALLAAATFPAAAAFPAALPRQQGGVGSFGIQLLGAPGKVSDAPLSRVYIVDRLAPGTSITRRVEITNGTRSVANVAVYPAAAGLRHGTFGFATGRKPNELSSWTSVSRGVLRLPAGGKAFETITINVPRNVSSGERHAVVWAEMSGSPGRASGVTLVNRVGIRMYLTVGRGGAGVAGFTVGSLHAGRSANGQPYVAATMRNSGRQPLILSGSLALSDGPGGLRIPTIPVVLAAILAPSDSEQAKVSLDKRLPRGPWHAQLRLGSGTIHRTAEATITFPSAAPAARSATASNLSVSIVAGFLSVLIAAPLTVLLFRRSSSWRRP